ncbi:MAG TPA: type II toxin-antitoxin system RelE/ParE family toxin [Nitrospirae bacterium]|nr:type II toxin-antitoxin system RelE/ParE family toxin [Nitrospirota bacterium]
MKLKILASASQDLLDGYRFYEKQTEGLGTYFLDTLFSDIDSLAIYAGIHPVFFGKYNRVLSRRFPFAILWRDIRTTTTLRANSYRSILTSRYFPGYLGSVHITV